MSDEREDSMAVIDDAVSQGDVVDIADEDTVTPGADAQDDLQDAVLASSIPPPPPTGEVTQVLSQADLDKLQADADAKQAQADAAAAKLHEQHDAKAAKAAAQAALAAKRAQEKADALRIAIAKQSAKTLTETAQTVQHNVGRVAGDIAGGLERVATPGSIMLPIGIILLLYFLIVPINGQPRIMWLWQVIIGQSALVGTGNLPPGGARGGPLVNVDTGLVGDDMTDGNSVPAIQESPFGRYPGNGEVE